MLKTIQIIALLQGVFLLFIVVKYRNHYKKPNFWLLFSCLLSVIFYTIGDDDYNLFYEDTDWFVFHDILIITLFFLFVKYYKSGQESFKTKDFLYFTPYIINVVLHAGYVFGLLDATVFLIIIKEFTELCFLIYLLMSIYYILKIKKENWLLLFAVPLTVIFTIDELMFLLTQSNDSPFFLDSYVIIIIAVVLFYYVLYKLILAPKDILPKPDDLKYEGSRLQAKDVTFYRVELVRLMEEDKLFKNHKLTVNDVSKQLGIPRQQLSEILNVHMKIGFQDLLNQYRIDEFIQYLQSEDYKNYTLLGIATEVGFSSKTSFNTTFKKVKGVTPSQFKKQLSLK